MSEDYLKGYREGFRDGFKEGRTETKVSYNPLFPFPDPAMQYEPRCPVCGIRWDKPMGYVCGNSKCPTKITCGTGPDNISSTFGTKTWEDSVKSYTNSWVNCSDEGC